MKFYIIVSKSGPGKGNPIYNSDYNHRCPGSKCKGKCSCNDDYWYTKLYINKKWAEANLDLMTKVKVINIDI